jgi:hypothetical protein
MYVIEIDEMYVSNQPEVLLTYSIDGAMEFNTSETAEDYAKANLFKGFSYNIKKKL